ncbi:MAG TPA: SDR family oxidoreductase [Chitinophagaceae bacterium]|nr:SDR family oxidoreductase [Chitinophagaceae bacterium]
MNIIITGASKGIGKAIAKQFAANNTLFLCARNEDQLNATANELRRQFPQSIIHTKIVDMRQKQSVQEFAAWCLSFGAPDILVNNAGQFLPGSVHAEQDGILEKLIETNLYSAYYLTRALLPAIIKNNAGHIFNICSIASLQAYSNGGSYSISKFALLGFNKNLREELKPHNIKVTAVLPGAAYTDSWAGSGVDEKRIMEANDVAKMVFAASQLSPQACVEEILLRPQLGDL